MSKDEIINLIKTATYIDDEVREKWINLIPTMNQTQFDEFNKLINWAEGQKKKLNNESALVECAFYQMFAAMKHQGIKIAKKETYAMAESRSKSKEEKQLESLLNTDGNKV